MRFLLVAALVIASEGIAHAQPLRVTIECEDTGRTKACPAFLLGFVDAHPVMLQAPRAVADVIVYANATEVALVDHIHLRLVGRLADAPQVIELDVDVDSRADDDTQRAQLEPAFLRGMALFVAARFPKLVTVTLAAPDGAEAEAKETSPWDLSFEIGGFMFRANEYQNYNGWSSAQLARTDRRTRAVATLNGNGGISRQPPLVLDDGTEVSVNSQNWLVSGQLLGAWLYNNCYSLGGATSTWREDPKGQFHYGWDVKVGAEWDRFPADDPRGNRLAVLYVVGYQVDRYNLRNVLGERFAQYPIHELIASGKVRKDKVSLGLRLSAGSELIHPGRRHHVTASPNIEWQIGSHVDINVSFTITKRELPGPDESLIDPTDYAQLSRLSYAEPLSMNGNFSLKIHRDRTNGQRNDRFQDL